MAVKGQGPPEQPATGQQMPGEVREVSAIADFTCCRRHLSHTRWASLAMQQSPGNVDAAEHIEQGLELLFCLEPIEPNEGRFPSVDGRQPDESNFIALSA
mmetsp:Transcript_72411/g.172576  ORF Transcript_72411/g.172576 Transcript_72411/m.172576 type:complete len:100 (-) Transcript_72411:967-1266(-)